MHQADEDAIVMRVLDLAIRDGRVAIDSHKEWRAQALVPLRLEHLDESAYVRDHCAMLRVHLADLLV